MGRRNRAAVTTMWAPMLASHRDGRALALAYTIADSVPDGSDEWWGRQQWVAEMLGLVEFGEPLAESARQAARRTVRRLVAVGLLEVLDRPRPGRAGTYRCHWKEPPIMPRRPL